MSQDAPPPKRRRLRRVLYVALALGAVAVAALFTGRPQDALAEYVISRQLGGRVTIDGLRTWGRIQADRLELAGPALGGGTQPPVAVIENLRIDYHLPGISDRLIGAITIESAQINLDARTGRPSNFAFLLDRPRDPGAGGINPRWLPQAVAVSSLDIVAAINDARTSARGLSVDGEFPGGDSASLRLAGRGMNVAFSGLVEAVESAAVTGDALVTLTIDGDAVALEASAVLEQTGDLIAQGRAALSCSWLEPNVELVALDATLGSASLDGRVLDEFVAGLTDGQVAFDSLIAEPSHVRVEFAEGGGLPAIEGAVLVQGLRLRTAGQTVYEGDLTIGADVPGGDVREGVLQLSLDEAHVIVAEIEGSRDTGSVGIRGENWEKDKLMALLPPAAHRAVRPLDFDRADLHGRVEWTPAGYAAEGRLTRADTSEPVARFNARLPDEAEWTADGVVTLGGGTVELAYAGRALDAFQATATFENIALSDALAMAGAAPESEVRGAIGGSASAQATADSDYFMYEGAATLSGVSMDPIEFETITTEFQGRFTRAGDRAELSHVTFDTGDGVTRAGFTDVVVTFEPLKIQSQLVAGLDLTRVAQWYEMPDLFGEVEVVGPLRYSEPSLQVPVTVRCTTLGYGDLVLPYRTVLHTDITARYDTSSEEGILEGFSMRVGDGTSLSVSPTRFLFDPVQLDPTFFDMKSDLAILASMGLFSSVTGSAVLRGTAGYVSEAVSGEWELETRTSLLVFPEDIVAAEGLVLQAEGQHGDAIEGSGSVAIERLTIAGGRLSGLEGDIAIAENVVSIPDLRGGVFNGRFAGAVSAHILEPGLPAEVSGRLMEFDLARFTEEVQPPETQLTGIANGSFSVRNTLDGVEDLTVHATCTEDFSLNRDMVRQILESEALAGALGIGQIERTVGKFLGEAPQRPFDSAELSLHDEGERLRGTAVLLSEKTEDYNGLNLTIELAIDEEALLQTLQMLQDSEIANVQF